MGHGRLLRLLSLWWTEVSGDEVGACAPTTERAVTVGEHVAGVGLYIRQERNPA